MRYSGIVVDIWDFCVGCCGVLVGLWDSFVGFSGGYYSVVIDLRFLCWDTSVAYCVQWLISGISNLVGVVIVDIWDYCVGYCNQVADLWDSYVGVTVM